MSTFVSVGNAKQPFTRLLQTVRADADALPPPVFVQHGHTPWAPHGGIEARDFICMEEFTQRVQGAQVVVLHAGAGSVIHAVRAGKVPIILPRRSELGEHVDDHQVEFARELADERRVVLFDDNLGLGVAVRQARLLQAEQATLGSPPLIGMVALSLRTARQR